MPIEGMGRRRPGRDWQRDLDAGIEDAVAERHQRAAAELVQSVKPLDQSHKALTGRRIADYVLESGVEQYELLPDGADVLNIGDPWQTLDYPGVTTLEYETGDEASFICDADQFFGRLPRLYDTIQQEATYLQQDQPAAAALITQWLHSLQQFDQIRLQLDDYPKQAAVANQLAADIAVLVPGVYQRYPNAWYAAIQIGRGYNDLYLNATVIEPAIAKANLDRHGFTDQQEADMRRQLIEAHRGQSRYSDSTLVKGAFPHTDFPDKAFDRIIASWSISAHMFAAMNSLEFGTTWEEVDRILRSDGAAYFWPIDYGLNDPSELISSLRSYSASGGRAGFVIREDSQMEIQWVDELDDDQIDQLWRDSMYALVVLSRGYDQYTLERIEHSVQSDDDQYQKAVA